MRKQKKQERNATSLGWIRIEDGIASRNGNLTIDLVIDGKRVRKSVKSNNLNAARLLRDSIIENNSASVAKRTAQNLFADHSQPWNETVQQLQARGAIRKKYLDLKRSARERNIEFFLLEQEMLEAILHSNGVCALTGIPLEIGTTSRHPFKLSIDRIDSNGPYRFDNLRVICFCVNVAIGEWGDKVLAAMSVGFTRNMMKTLEESITNEIRINPATHPVTQQSQ